MSEERERIEAAYAAFLARLGWLSDMQTCHAFLGGWRACAADHPAPPTEVNELADERRRRERAEASLLWLDRSGVVKVTLHPERGPIFGEIGPAAGPAAARPEPADDGLEAAVEELEAAKAEHAVALMPSTRERLWRAIDRVALAARARRGEGR